MSNSKLNKIFKTVCIASDHAGFKLKENIKNHLIENNVSIFDVGPFDDKSVDYPDYAKKLGFRIKSKGPPSPRNGPRRDSKRAM